MPEEEPVAILSQRIDGLVAQFEMRANLIAKEFETRCVMIQQQMDQRFDSIHDTYLDLRIMLDERYATQTKALDAAFLAQQTAMRTALEAAEKAVATALISAEKAVTKAEVASDKRFESVNEFRKQLADQTSTFPTREEVNIRMTSVSDQTDRNATRIGELELRLTSRLDVAAGHSGGQDDYRTERRLDVGQAVQILALLVLAASVIITLIATHR
jgi:hypothetical protein